MQDNTPVNPLDTLYLIISAIELFMEEITVFSPKGEAWLWWLLCNFALSVKGV